MSSVQLDREVYADLELQCPKCNSKFVLHDATIATNPPEARSRSIECPRCNSYLMAYTKLDIEVTAMAQRGEHT